MADSRGTSFLLEITGGAWIPYFDKIGHFLLMGGLSFFVNLVWHGKTVSLGPLPVLAGSLLVSLIVTIEEFSQIFIGGRAFDYGDLAADYLGIFIFGQLAGLIYRKKLTEKDSDGRIDAERPPRL